MMNFMCRMCSLCCCNVKTVVKTKLSGVLTQTKAILYIIDKQEPIKWSVHLPYKPLESTLSRADL